MRFVISVRTSVSLSCSSSFLMGQFDCHWTKFYKICYCTIFRKKSVGKFELSLKSDMNTEYFIWSSIYSVIISRWILLKLRNVSEKSCRKNQKAYFMLNNTSPWDSSRLWDNMGKILWSRTGHTFLCVLGYRTLLVLLGFSCCLLG